MGEPQPLRVDTPSLQWDPAEVTVPPVPVIPPGGDPMSAMISAVMPELAAPLTAAVAATHAREERFAANLAGARSAYQSTDQAGEQEIRTVADTQLAPATTSAASTGSVGGQSGQFMSTAMQMASQAVQAPMQLMGLAASGPQSVMQGAQGAMQQMGQLSGQIERPEGEKDSSVETTDNDAGAGSSSAERVPATDPGSAESTMPQRVRQPDGFDSIDL
ncbi:hypothetical protein NGTWS1803_27830 [Mycolicibacterium cyprinidarum]|nr:hypothetical protein NGTWS1803_27830 [Mycolicibacterium sp. NGTWS1803]